MRYMIKESPHINSSFDLSLTKEKSKGENKKNNFIYLKLVDFSKTNILEMSVWLYFPGGRSQTRNCCK